jgi:replicative DNA helicase
MTKTNDYNDDVQRLLIGVLLSNEEIFARCQNILNARYFVNTLRPVMRHILEFAEKYRALPRHEQIQAEFGISLERVDGINAQQADAMLDQIEEFCRNRALADAVLSAGELIQKGNYSEVEKRVREAILVGLSSDIGTSYFADPRARLMKIKSSNGQISSGWKTIDNKLYGGVNRKEITIWCGGSGCVAGNTKVKIIKLPSLPDQNTVSNRISYLSEEYEYLKQLYAPCQIDLHCGGSNARLHALWKQCQPQEIEIKDLVQGFDNNSLWLVDSPDGWVPVVDTQIKHKIQMFQIVTSSGKSLTCSYDHYLQLENQAWRYAQNVQLGDALLTLDGPDTVVEKTELGASDTYDIEVGHHNHRYYSNRISSHNSGKSLFLQNLAVNFITQGLNTVYISLELSEELCSMRIDSMISDIPSKDIFKRIDEVEIKVLQAGKKKGNLHIKQLAQGTTVNDIRVYLKNYEIETGKKCDVLIVDYLDLLFPNNKKIDPSNLNIVGKFVTEELRGLGVERNMNIQTASQLNRSAVDSQEHSHAHIAGGISKIQTADNVMSIYSTPAMRDRGQYQVQFLKTRSSSGVGSNVMLGFNIENLRIFDLEEDSNPAPTKTAADMMGDLRRKNSSNDSRKQDQPEADPVVNKSIATLKELTAMIRR